MQPDYNPLMFSFKTVSTQRNSNAVTQTSCPGLRLRTRFHCLVFSVAGRLNLNLTNELNIAEITAQPQIQMDSTGLQVVMLWISGFGNNWSSQAYAFTKILLREWRRMWEDRLWIYFQVNQKTLPMKIVEAAGHIFKVNNIPVNLYRYPSNLISEIKSEIIVRFSWIWGMDQDKLPSKSSFRQKKQFVAQSFVISTEFIKHWIKIATMLQIEL